MGKWGLSMSTPLEPLLLTLSLAGGAQPSVLHREPAEEPAEIPIVKPEDANPLAELRREVQTRRSNIEARSTIIMKDSVQISQWFNWRDWYNSGCFRGYWRNC